MVANNYVPNISIFKLKTAIRLCYDAAVAKHAQMVMLIIPAEMDVNKENRGEESATNLILDLDFNPAERV